MQYLHVKTAHIACGKVHPVDSGGLSVPTTHFASVNRVTRAYGRKPYIQINKCFIIFIINCSLHTMSIFALWGTGLILGVRLGLWFKAGVTKLFETQSCFLVQIHAKGYKFDTQTSEIKICRNCLHMMLSLIIKIEGIHHCKETDHIYAIVRTGSRATHVVHTWATSLFFFFQKFRVSIRV